jgi:surfeit locus 1 family protein
MRLSRPPRPVTALATALAVTAFALLGYWQLDRAREKQALIDRFSRGDAVVVDVTSRSVDGVARYQAVSARGSYEPHRQVLLDNMPSADGRPGYRVLTPFRRADGRPLLLVDRGWVALGDSRERLPSVAVADDAREIMGRIDSPPAPGLRLHGAARTGVGGWPRVMNFPTADELAIALAEPIERSIVLLDPGAPDGYERRWQPALHVNPARHVAYAIQWFAFAVAAVVVPIVASLRRPRRGAR